MRKLKVRKLSARTLQNLKKNQPKSKVPKKLLQNRFKGSNQVSGRNAVKEVLETVDRDKIIALYIEKDSEKDPRVAQILESSKGIKRYFLQKDEFRRLVKDDARGVMLLVKDENRDLNIKLAVDRDTSPKKTVVLFNEVEYEQNLGAIVRSCEALGANTIVLANRVKTKLSPVVRRISMGATERIAMVNENLFVAIAELKRLGFLVYAIETNGKQAISDVDLSYDKIAFVLGGEDKGVTEPLADKCDGVISIPMQGLMGSLNVSVSTGIVLYERSKQILS